MPKDVIIACDFDSKDKTKEFLKLFTDKKPFLKVGMELFYAEGTDIVRMIKDNGHKVFLDLKLHDIPNTVHKAMKVLSSLGVDMVNVHASGTMEMMKAAREGLSSDALLIAVTQLTSTSSDSLNRELLIEKDMNYVVEHYAKMSQDSGLDGVVCSALETEIVKKACGQNFLTVTPGIRPANEVLGDQKRVMTPSQARQIGSDYIVVGRPITQAKDPYQAYKDILHDFIG